MSVPTATIRSAGRVMDARYRFVALEVNKEVDRIPYARITVLDGDLAEQAMDVSNSDVFAPGKEIEILLRYEGGEDATIFKGLVVRQCVEADLQGFTLAIDLKDGAIKLTQPPRSAVFRDQTDGQVIAQIVEDAGLKAGEIATTEPEHPTLVQYRATDWDFILSRADVQGLVVVASDGTLSARKPEPSGDAGHTFELGVNDIRRIELQLDGAGQHAGVESMAWNPAKQATTRASEAEPVELAQGNVDGGAVAEALGFAPYALSHLVATDPRELSAWANARLLRSRLALIRGRVVIAGTAEIRVLDRIVLDGVGERFDGTALVTGVRQRVDREGWETELTLGLSPDWFCRARGVNAPRAAGLLPAIGGLHVGSVAAFEADPDGEHRVKVVVPALGADGAVWARVASPDAGKERGFVFRLEPGDEVVVGFFDDDPRQPVVLGSMFSSANVPPAVVGEADEDNLERAIVTKAGTVVAFSDGDKAKVSIETAGGNAIAIDDDAEQISLTDQHGNSITLSADGIVLESAGDFTVKAAGNVVIEGEAVDVA